MIARRSFIAGTAALLLARPGWAQEGKAQRVVRVGVLDPLPAANNAANVEQLLKGLRAAGYSEGRNLVIEYRSSEGRAGRYARLAEELTRIPVDILIARGTQAALGAKNATQELPIVALGVNDPVDTGLVAALERPGGNVTGIAFRIKDLEARRVDALRALAPKTRRIAGLMNAGNPAIAHAWKMLEEAARGFKLEAVLVDVRKRSQIEQAFDAAREHDADALIVQLGSLGAAQRQSVVERHVAGTRKRSVAQEPPRERAGTSSPDATDRAAQNSYVSPGARITTSARFPTALLKASGSCAIGGHVL